MPDYAPGTPSWVDLSSRDADASGAFYSELFGWSLTEAAEETGGYRMFLQDDQPVAGLMPVSEPEQPTAWSTYVSVADADAIVEKAKAAGGAVVVEPMDVMDLGRMGFFADPTGAVVGVWQPRTFPGAGVVNVPNSLCWNEILTRDMAAARPFYEEVFGWKAVTPEMEGAPDSYLIWELDGAGIGGGMEMSAPYFPDEVPPHWAVSFAVADCDASTAKAVELGATVTAGPMDLSIGRFTNLLDPQGAPLAVMQLASS